MSIKGSAVFLAIFVASISCGATYYASPDGTDDAECTIDNPGTIQAAVAAANANNSTRTSWENSDTVMLLPGTYDFRNGSKGVINKSLTGANFSNMVIVVQNYLKICSQSETPTNTIIMGGRGSSTARAFVLKGKIQFCGITVSNFYTGKSGDGSGIFCSDNVPIITNCIVTRCGIGYATGGSVYKGTVYNSKFISNGTTSDRCYGSGTYNSIVYNSYYYNNKAGRNGGAARYGKYHNCIFESNLNSGMPGGAVSDATCVDCIFISSSSNQSGSTAYNSTLINCIITNSASSTAVNGGKCIDTAIVNCKSGAAKDAVLVNCRIENNVAEKVTPGLQNCTTTNCIIKNNRCTYSYNKAYYGAGVNGGSHYNALFENNTPNSVGAGGGIYNATARKSRFIGHKGNNASVALSSTLIDCEIVDNSAAKDNLLSAGKYQRCIIANNTSANSALIDGGVFDNCLIVENSTSGTSGGDIASASVFVNSTIANNSPISGKGGLSGTVVATNSIFSSNGAYDLSSGVTALNCLYATTNAIVTPINCVVTSNPLFRGSRVAPERPYSLRAASPAINAGTMEDITYDASALDIYGRKRFVGTIDIGCAEYLPTDDPTKFIVR